MNSFSILALLLCVAVCYSAPESPREYSTKFDNIDLEPILKSKRLVQAYVLCVTKNIGCTAEGKLLKEYLPDALKTNCAKCSVKQRDGAAKAFNRLEKEYPEELKKVLDHFDADRQYYTAYRKANPLP